MSDKCDGSLKVICDFLVGLFKDNDRMNNFYLLSTCELMVFKFFGRSISVFIMKDSGMFFFICLGAFSFKISVESLDYNLAIGFIIKRGAILFPLKVQSPFEQSLSNAAHFNTIIFHFFKR